jgi:methionyl-tRNA synthetase
MNGFYVTTAIPYVNAAPHLGHALELVQADVLARHRRRRGQPVRFLTGTDENALKNVTAARAAGVAVVRIEPETRRNEVLAFVRSGLADISVSRPAARAGGWGIPVPDDPEQVVYVWWDALANYVTALADDELDEWWLRSAERVHVVGKGIVRFHAVHWLALLTAVGLPLPTAVFVHPYLTVDGAKISKSAGTGVDPVELVGRFGVDAVRWWLLREASGRADTDFTHSHPICQIASKRTSIAGPTGQRRRTSRSTLCQASRIRDDLL